MTQIELTPNEIIENNKLFAEFMGIRYDENRNSHESSEYYYEDCELEYHSSWNWLMPVVEKIESDVLDGDVIVTIDGDNVCIVYGTKYRNEVYGYTKFESCYKALIEFIKWYNANKTIS